MSARDRLVLMGIAALAVVGAVWMLAVSPARKQASTLAGEVASVQGQLAGVKGELASASEVQVRYRRAYTSLVSLGKAVPTGDEVPGLMYAIDQAANHKKVQFTSISSGSSGHPSSSSSSSSAASAAAQSAGLHQLPFTFTFSGSYQDLCRLLVQLESFTAQGRSGALKVSGRLLTIQSVTLGGSAGGSSAGAGSGSQASKPGEMTWTITASAYVLPASAASSSEASGTPAGAQPSGAATTPTSSPGTGAAPAPAVVKVGP
jgi:Tfp pilus assembly protein PilO